MSPKEDTEPRSNPPKPLFSKTQFHSLPHSSMKSRSNFASWEANNLMEEMTHGSHAFHRSMLKSEQSSTMDLDSLSARYAEDSLNFDLQEVAEEDSLTPDDDFSNLEHDSLQPKEIKEPKKEKKKLIIPYNESFSSTTSVFTTSQDGSLENQTEEDSLTRSNPNLTLNMVPLKPFLNDQQPIQKPNLYKSPAQPLIIGPEYQPNTLYHHQPAGPLRPEIAQAQQTRTVANTSSSSLMKLATERMKKKFLGWS